MANMTKVGAITRKGTKATSQTEAENVCSVLVNEDCQDKKSTGWEASTQCIPKKECSLFPAGRGWEVVWENREANNNGMRQISMHFLSLISFLGLYSHNLI